MIISDKSRACVLEDHDECTYDGCACACHVELMDCPHYTSSKDDRCNLPSELVRRSYASSTDGPVEVIAIRCVEGHFFAGPADLMWS